jgi:hypothetical protein
MLKGMLLSNNKPNITFYGDNHNHAMTEIQEYLSFDLNKSEVVVNNLSYIVTRNIFVFKINLIKNSNYDQFNNTLHEIIKSPDYFYKNRKTIILLNFNHIKNNIQLLLRVFIEKYSQVCSFIIFTRKLNYIIQPIQSRCLLLKTKNDSKSLNISLKDTQNIITKSPFHIFIDQMLSIYHIPFSSKTVQKIKDLIKQFALLHIDRPSFNLNLIEIISILPVSDLLKYQMIKYISDLDHKFIKSYRDIIYYELLFIYIHSKIDGLL